MSADADRIAQLTAEVERLRQEMPLDRRCAEALADEEAVLVLRGVIDSRSPAADALLDYRNPPSSPRADSLATERAAHERTKADLERVKSAYEMLSSVYDSADEQLTDAGFRECPPDEPHALDVSCRVGNLIEEFEKLKAELATGRALAERVPLWRELERKAHATRAGHDTTCSVCCLCSICDVSRKLAAIDAKEKTDG